MLTYLKGFKGNPSSGTIPRLMTVVAKAARSKEALELATRYVELLCVTDQADTLRALLATFISVIDQSGRIARFSTRSSPTNPSTGSVRALSFEPTRAPTLELSAKAPGVKALIGMGLAAIFLGLAVSVSARGFVGR